MSQPLQQHKLKCPRPDCTGNGEFQYLGESKSMTIVNDEGKVVYFNGTFVYKCMSCGITFNSEVQPQIKKLMHG